MRGELHQRQDKGRTVAFCRALVAGWVSRRNSLSMKNSIKLISIVFVVFIVFVGFSTGNPGTQETLTPNQNPGWTLPFPSAETGPCEELGNPTLGPDKRITIKLNQRERELIHLATEGWIVDMEHELVGVGGWTGGIYPVLFGDTGKPGAGPATPPFHARAFFLNYFIKVVGPSIQERVYGQDLISDFNLEVFGGPVATEEELRQNVQEITFTDCERTGISIAIEKWSDRADGQMGRHLRICDHSQQMDATSSCASFRPLAKAYKSLTKKLEGDQD